jgi:CRISPR-associated protein Cmr5
MAQAAFGRVQEKRDRPEKYSERYRKEYRSFAREFPTLVHQCGLAQAVVFAQAKKDHQLDYVTDLAAVLKAAVLNAAGHANIASAEALAGKTRSLPMAGYVRLSRDALDAAVWLKRYVEALFEDQTPQPQGVKS